jgi:hypothetical protein
MDTLTFKYLQFLKLPTDISIIIFLFLFGEDFYLLNSNDLKVDEIKSFIYSKHNFIEGIEFYLFQKNTKTIIQNLLYGSAYSGNIELMLRIKNIFFGKILNKEDLISSIDYALENGQISYITYIIFILKNPNEIHFSINKWLKYCRKQIAN